MPSTERDFVKMGQQQMLYSVIVASSDLGFFQHFIAEYHQNEQETCEDNHSGLNCFLCE